MDPSILLIGAMIIVFYFLILRPQTQQAKKTKEFQASIEKGSRIVTGGGIHGKIIRVDDSTILLEVDNNVKMRIEKASISLELTQAAYGEGDKKSDAAASKKTEATDAK